MHPRVLEAIAAANAGHAFGYGHDPVHARRSSGAWPPRSARLTPSVFFVFNGSGANVLSLRAALKPWEAAIVSANAHLQTDEVGAPEAVAGVKLLVAETEDGRVTLDGVRRLVERPNDEHAVKPGLLSLTQATELGTLYYARRAARPGGAGARSRPAGARRRGAALPTPRPRSACLCLSWWRPAASTCSRSEAPRTA